MRTELFDFHLPAELIAQHPVRPRDAARLLVVQRRSLLDRAMCDLPALLRPGDLLLLNDTRVLPVRLFGRRDAAAVEVTLIQPMGGGRWRAFAKPARRCRPGDSVEFAPGFAATVGARGEDGEITLVFDEPDLAARLERYGSMPLPPYIRRPKGGDPRDLEDYQTLFARRDGAIAAPTAAL
ncbi:MAG: S-adenosylmethionine:tRNA ribosyltransferase-isomerase, partial [Geminicoccaceae bacterium]